MLSKYGVLLRVVRGRSQSSAGKPLRKHIRQADETETKMCSARRARYGADSSSLSVIFRFAVFNARMFKAKLGRKNSIHLRNRSPTAQKEEKFRLKRGTSSMRKQSVFSYEHKIIVSAASVVL